MMEVLPPVLSNDEQEGVPYSCKDTNRPWRRLWGHGRKSLFSKPPANVGRAVSEHTEAS